MIGIEDLEIPPQKPEIIESARGDTERFTRAYSKGVISNGEIGRTVAGLGDVDGDGHADYAAGGPSNIGHPNGSFNGHVIAWSGRTGKKARWPSATMRSLPARTAS